MLFLFACLLLELLHGFDRAALPIGLQDELPTRRPYQPRVVLKVANVTRGVAAIS